MEYYPKRRKDFNNPYTLSYCEKSNTYIISFKDSRGIQQVIEVNEQIYQAFNKFELEDISQMNKFDRHIEHSELFDESLHKRAVDKPLSVEEIVENKINNEKLREAIQELPEIQRNRLKKYYFDNMSFEEIAKEEHCTKRAVKFSVDLALEKISKKFQK